MQLSTERSGKITFLTISGRVDATHADDLYTSLSVLLRHDQLYVIIDCKEVEYLSSSGMRAFLHALDEAKTKGGKLLFVAFCPMVLEVLELAGIAKYFEQYTNRHDAEKEMLAFLKSA